MAPYHHPIAPAAGSNSGAPLPPLRGSKLLPIRDELAHRLNRGIVIKIHRENRASNPLGKQEFQIFVSEALVDQDDHAEIILVSDHATDRLVQRTKRLFLVPQEAARRRWPSSPSGFGARVVVEALLYDLRAHHVRVWDTDDDYSAGIFIFEVNALGEDPTVNAQENRARAIARCVRFVPFEDIDHLILFPAFLVKIFFDSVQFVPHASRLPTLLQLAQERIRWQKD
mmetsp:Transcript_12293/g.31022  ORF Transcript_12293/g.31022 Transcript_12293/m.31022 type:complete len:227 (-) Transcript_12293:1088-1768(-)